MPKASMQDTPRTRICAERLLRNGIVEAHMIWALIIRGIALAIDSKLKRCLLNMPSRVFRVLGPLRCCIMR